MPSIAATLLLLGAVLVVACLLQPLADRLRLPHGVLLVVLGILLGIVQDFGAGMPAPTGTEMDAVATTLGAFQLGSDTILFVFLPLLLFQMGLTVDVRRMLDAWEPGGLP